MSKASVSSNLTSSAIFLQAILCSVFKNQKRIATNPTLSATFFTDNLTVDFFKQSAILVNRARELILWRKNKGINMNKNKVIGIALMVPETALAIYMMFHPELLLFWALVVVFGLLSVLGWHILHGLNPKDAALNVVSDVKKDIKALEEANKE